MDAVLIKEKVEPTSELMIEPKTEYMDENNEDSVEDLTLDDDDDMDMNRSGMDMGRPGPSHGDSNQGFATSWHMQGDRSGTDEVFMAAQEAVGAQRDSQGLKVDKKMNGGLRVRQNLLEPECLVSMDNAKASAASSSSGRILAPAGMYGMPGRTAFDDVSIKSPVGCLRRDTGVLGKGLSLVNMNSKQGIENCYYEHFILDYRVPIANNTMLSNSGGSAAGTERITIDSVMSMKPRKTKFPALAFFSCEDCGRCYRSKTSLGLHKRLECGKEPTFQCPYCPLKTHQKGNLNVHIKKKHSNLPHVQSDGNNSDGGGCLDVSSIE